MELLYGPCKVCNRFMLLVALGSKQRNACCGQQERAQKSRMLFFFAFPFAFNRGSEKGKALEEF